MYDVETINYKDFLCAEILGEYPYLLVQLVPKDDEITLQFEAGNLGEFAPTTQDEFIELLRELTAMAERGESD